MRPLTILCALSTLSATLAVPFSQASNSTSTSKSTSSSSGKFKQCCTTLSQVGDNVFKPLGEIVPLLGAIEVNSLIGLSCKAMDDEAPETDCADAVMCCDSSAVAADNFMQTSCVDFAQAKKQEREAIERQQRRFSAMQRMMMSQSATPSLTSVSATRSSVSGAMAIATPTKV